MDPLNERLIVTSFGLFMFTLSLGVFESFVKSNVRAVKRTVRSMNPLQQLLPAANTNATQPVVLNPYQAFVYKQSLQSFRLQKIKMKLLKISMVISWTLVFRCFGFQYIFRLMFPSIDHLFLPALKEFHIYRSFVIFTFENIDLYLAFIMVVMLGRIRSYKIRKIFYAEILLMLIGSLCFEHVHTSFIKNLDQAHWISKALSRLGQILSNNESLLPLKLLFPFSVSLWVYYSLFTENWKMEFFFQIFLYSVTLETLKYGFNWLQPGWGNYFVAPLITFLILM